MSTSRSRNNGSSSEGEDLEVELMDLSVHRRPSEGFTGGGLWGMVMAYSMVAMNEAH